MKKILIVLLILFLHCGKNNSTPIVEAEYINDTTEDFTPIHIILVGVFDEIYKGFEMNLHVTSSNADNVIYHWYLDGNKIHTGKRYTTNENLEIGFHRITVMAYTKSGNRCGSASRVFKVNE
jgi:hypothetical protein